MHKEYERLKDCAAFVTERTAIRPKVGIVLGSGLGDFAKRIQIETILSYQEIPGFPVSGVAGHAGQFVFGHIGTLPVVIMQGRVHYYEGYSMQDVVLPIRLMHEIGAEILCLTNAAGGLNYEFQPGDLMMITDQIASFVPSPLIGANLDQLGLRFPDMSQIYDWDLQELIRSVAKEKQISLQEGVYIQLSGSNYETPHEVKMCRILGADAVGMSTACEAIAANHMQMKICGISCITNMACGMTDQPLSHEEVQETSQRVKKDFEELLYTVMERIGSQIG